MEKYQPATTAASAVSQALGEIGPFASKRPSLLIPTPLKAPGRTQPSFTHNHPTLRSPASLRSETDKAHTTIGNQQETEKLGCHATIEQLTSSRQRMHTAVVIGEGLASGDTLGARRPLRLLRSSGVFQVQHQRQEHVKYGETAALSSPPWPSAQTPPELQTRTKAKTPVDAGPVVHKKQPTPITDPKGILLLPLHPTLPLFGRKPTRRPPSPRKKEQREASRAAADLPVRAKQAQQLYFQDSNDERRSSINNCTVVDPTGGSTTAIATDTETEEEAEDRAPGHRHRQCKRNLHCQSPSRQQTGSGSSAKPERIGELSREEDEFDFAILLKPSKHEEKLDFPDALATLETSNSTFDLPQLRDKANTASSQTSKPRAQSTLKPTSESASARAVIMSRIERTGLRVKRLLSLDGKQSLLKVCAPPRVLELGAERLRLRKQRRFDQVWMVFSCELRTSFFDYDASHDRVNFLDSEKQSIVHALLTAAESDGGAGLHEFCPVTSRFVLQMYPLHKQDLALLKARWVTFWRRSPSTSFLGFRSGKDNSPGTTGRCLLVQGVLQQPLDDVAQYFGERIAFYFAWMEMYTRWLVVPSVAGAALFALQVHSRQLDHPAAPLYALFMALWTSAFLIAWRRRAAALAYRWGTLGYEDEEVMRPEFYGESSSSTEGTSDNNGENTHNERRYAPWKRLLKYAVTIPCVGGSIAAVVALTYTAFSTRDRLEAQSLAAKRAAAAVATELTTSGVVTLADLRTLARLGVSWDFWGYLLLTPMLYGLLIPVMDFVFTRAARALNNWENHRTESHYQSHLILKVFSFRFVHVFASLYYYAFAPLDVNIDDESSTGSGEKDSSSTDNSLLRVAIQLASFMVAGQFLKNVKETLYPFVRRRMQVRAKKRATNAQFNQSQVFNGGSALGPRAANLRSGGSRTRLAEASLLSTNAVIHEQCVRLEQASDRAWEEAELQTYDTFEDYTEMLVQFGYVSFFSLAFPLAPLLALLNNLVELRTDAFKLCHAKQRPLARKASGIGVWLYVLQLMSVLAVLTNCLHMAFSTSLLERAFPTVTPTQKVWIVFGVEHLLLLLKVWLAAVIPAMPRDVKESLRREREHAKHDSARAMATRMLAEAAAGGRAKGESNEITGLKQAAARHRTVKAHSST